MSDISLSPRRAELLIQSVTDYAIYMLDPSGVVISWNAGAERLKGYRPSEIIGRHFSRFYAPEDRDDGLPAKALSAALAEGRFEAEGWRVRRDGSRFWANVVIDAIRDEDGRHIGFAKVTRDLSERKAAEEALQRSQEQFFQSQKMEAIGRLTGGVAHDFNNILAAILGSLCLAQRRLAEGADISRFLDNAIAAAERGATLSQRMLAFARKQELLLEPVDLHNAVWNIVEMLQRTIGPGIAIKTDIPPGLPPAQVDRAQLELALVNLIVNARDAMPEGGEVFIAAEDAVLPDSVERYVRLYVIDDGTGMNPATLARAAEPFFTTKGVGKGTGLGLSMVQGMVEQCGGSLQIHSEAGKGTKVEILLPASDQIAAAELSPLPIPPADVRGLRILAVDDDETVLLNTVTILSDMGHEVWQADSGESALALLAKEEFDLLLTDYAMPNMSGCELAERARAVQPGLRVLVISGFAELSEREAFDHARLSKPFTEADLAKAISRAA